MADFRTTRRTVEKIGEVTGRLAPSVGTYMVMGTASKPACMFENACHRPLGERDGTGCPCPPASPRHAHRCWGGRAGLLGGPLPVTHRAQYLGVPPSGERFDPWNVMLLESHGDLICRDSSVSDASELRRLEPAAARRDWGG